MQVQGLRERRGKTRGSAPPPHKPAAPAEGLVARAAAECQFQGLPSCINSPISQAALQLGRRHMGSSEAGRRNWGAERGALPWLVTNLSPGQEQQTLSALNTKRQSRVQAQCSLSTLRHRPISCWNTGQGSRIYAIHCRHSLAASGEAFPPLQPRQGRAVTYPPRPRRRSRAPPPCCRRRLRSARTRRGTRQRS